MRRITRGMLFLLLGMICKAGLCQVEAPGPLPALSLGKCVQLSGMLDSYYSWNLTFPGTHLNAFHNFDAHNASLHLNLAEAGLSTHPDPVGFEIDGGVGDLYKSVHAGEPDSPLRNFLQTFVSHKVQTFHDLRFDRGKFRD